MLGHLTKASAMTAYRVLRMTWRDLQRPLGELECGGCPGVTTSQLTTRK